MITSASPACTVYLHLHLQVYIPAPPHYIQSHGASITPLSQMQVVTDFTEISRYTALCVYQIN